MSNSLLTAAWSLPLPSTQKVVLAALADRANDNGVTWIAIRSLRGSMDLMKMTSLSERAIQAAIKALVAAGHLRRDEVVGKGVNYTVHPRTGCTPAPGAPVQDARPAPDAPTPAPRAPKPSVPPPSGAKAPSSDKRAARLSPDWQPKRPYPPTVAKLVAGWPPGREDRELEGFVDYWTSIDRNAAKLDWDKTWHNRIRDQHDRIMNTTGARNGKRPFHDRPSGPIESRRRVRELHGVDDDAGD